MDIRQGDTLTLNPGETNQADYFIRSVADWTFASAKSPSFLRAAAVDCETKRGVASGGKTGDPTTNLSGLKCLPLMPVNAELAASVGLESAHETQQTVISDSTGFVHLIVSETKRTS